MKRWLVLLLVTALSGCATYEGYGYRDDGYYDDRYYEGPGYYRGSPRDEYAASGYGYGSDGFGYSAYPDYVLWSGYYSVLWPVYRGYYDPFYSPGYFYGVTWYPNSYFGLHYSAYAWPYYQPYAPYRYSYQDAYFDHWGQHRGNVHGRLDQRGSNDSGRYLFGSARNEAERLANAQELHRVQGAAQPGAQFQPYAARRQLRPSVPDFDTRPADLRQRPAQREFEPNFRTAPRGVQPPRSSLPQPRARDSRRFDRGNDQSSTPMPSSPQRPGRWVSDDLDGDTLPAAPGRDLRSSEPRTFEQRDAELEPALPSRSWTPEPAQRSRSVAPIFRADNQQRTPVYRSRQQITEPAVPLDRARTAPNYDRPAGDRREPAVEPRVWPTQSSRPRYEPSTAAPQRSYTEPPNAPVRMQRLDRAVPNPESQPTPTPPEGSGSQRSAREGSARDELRRERNHD